MTQNPNWPLIDVAVSFTSGPPDAMPAPYWCSMKARTLGQQVTDRGRQYELDQVQTGTWTGSLENTDAALDPANTGSPFYPQVLPYRAFRHRAQYPATINLLTGDQATAGKASGLTLGTLPSWVAGSGQTVTTVADTGSYNDYSIVYPGTPTTGTGLLLTGFSVTPGAALSGQCQARFTAGSAIQMCLQLQWINVTGGVISTSTGSTVTLTGSFAQVKVTATAPATAVGANLLLTNVNSPAGTSTVAASQFQVESNSTVSAYVQPNPWYSIFTGYVERWPQSWTMNGQFGTAVLTVVDAFGYLSQRKLLSSAYQEMLNTGTGPNFLYPLDEDTGASIFYDLASQRDPASIYAPKGLGGTPPAPGSSLVTPTGQTLGIGGPVILFANGVAANSQQDLITVPAASSAPVGPPTSTGWTRIVAFQTTNSTFNMILCAAVAPGALTLISGAQAAIAITGANSLSYLVSTGAVTGTVTATVSITDGAWHIAAMSVDPTGTTLHCYLDGTLVGTATTATDMRPNCAGGLDTFGGNPTNPFYGFPGSMSCLAEFPFAATSGQINLIASTFLYGGSGSGTATSASRYQDILRWSNWNGAQSVDNYPSGETVAYGPATELNATAADTGTDTVSALQTVVDTDAGFHYVAADGTVTFKARRARYNQNTPVVIFGEHTTSGEVPYTVMQTGFDNTRIANDISVIQTQTSAAQRSIDQTSADLFGDIQLQRTANTLNPLEQSDAANYLRLRNSQPVQRVEGITVNVGANPTLWPTMLALELGTRVRVMRRPPLGAAPIQVDGFVEQLNWTIDDQGNAQVDLQISVNNQQQYWQLDSSTFSILGTTTILGY